MACWGGGLLKLLAAGQKKFRKDFSREQPNPSERANAGGAMPAGSARAVSEGTNLLSKPASRSLLPGITGLALFATLFVLHTAHDKSLGSAALRGATGVQVRAVEATTGICDEQCSFEIWTVRHGEKEGSRRHLNERGRLRAEYLARFLAERVSNISTLVATNPNSAPFITREMDTLVPLSQRTGVPIMARFNESEGARVGDYLFGRPEPICGRNVVISWEHCWIPQMLDAVGCDTDACRACWDDADFDRVVRIVARQRHDPKSGRCVWGMRSSIETEGFGGVETRAPLRGAPRDYECARFVQPGNVPLVCSASHTVTRYVRDNSQDFG